MARARDPNRDVAYELYKNSKGEMLLKDIAEQIGKSEGTVRGWKSKDEWDAKMNGTLQSDERNAPIKRMERSIERDDISWLEIETEYITDIRKKPCTLKDLAEKYDIPMQTIKEYAQRNKWTTKRNSHHTNIIQKTTEKTATIISDDAAQATARHFAASNKLLEILEDAINTPGEFNKVVEKLRVNEFGEEEVQVIEIEALAEKRLSTVINSLASIQKQQRETLGILNVKDQIAVDKATVELEALRKNDSDGVAKVVIVDNIPKGDSV